MSPPLTRPKVIVPALKSAIPLWLDNWAFTRFVTLTFNDQSAGDARIVGSQLKYTFLRERLRKWDAHMNHALIGKYWADSSERMFNFYFLEKPSVNPHWHGLVRFFTDDADERERQELEFDLKAGSIWSKLLPGGTVNIQKVETQLGVAKYIAKAVPYPVGYENFIVADEFMRH